MESNDAQLRKILKTLSTYGVVPRVAESLSASGDAAAAVLAKQVRTEVEAYTATGNPEVMPELAAHIAGHIAEVNRLLAGGATADLAFVRAHAHRLAGQKFPLDALLSAYRCMHRLLATWIRDAALEVADDTAHVRRVVATVADFTIEYTGMIGTLATSEYVLQTRVLAEAEGDRRLALLNLLLSGYDESDQRAAQLLRRSGYLEQRQSFCVAVARAANRREMESPARVQRMVDAMEDTLRDAPVRTLIGVQDNLVTMVLSGTRRMSGWTAPQSLLAERTMPYLKTIGPVALIGVSADAPSTSHIPRALNEATLALDFASLGKRVMSYADIPFQRLMVRVAKDGMQSALPAWLDDLLAANEKAKGKLLTTLRTYADNDMNVLKTGDALSLHPNTVYARMKRIETITGRNPLSYNALTDLLLAAECGAG